MFSKVYVKIGKMANTEHFQAASLNAQNTNTEHFQAASLNDQRTSCDRSVNSRLYFLVRRKLTLEEVVFLVGSHMTVQRRQQTIALATQATFVLDGLGVRALMQSQHALPTKHFPTSAALILLHCKKKERLSVIGLSDILRNLFMLVLYFANFILQVISHIKPSFILLTGTFHFVRKSWFYI
jgi:hypothetical protein